MTKVIDLSKKPKKPRIDHETQMEKASAKALTVKKEIKKMNILSPRTTKMKNLRR